MARQAVTVSKQVRVCRLRAESWLTWLAMKYLGHRGYACHVGLCRDWVEMDGLR